MPKVVQLQLPARNPLKTAEKQTKNNTGFHYFIRKVSWPAALLLLLLLLLLLFSIVGKCI